MRIPNKTHKIKREALKNVSKQKPKYTEILQDVIKKSDILLEILDARFPEETRNIEIEEQIKKLNKKIIYALNKSDLIYKKKDINLNPQALISCKQRKGIKKLRDLIKRESKSILKSKEKINVGVIGYPNTGKSSLINILIGKASAGTAAQAGFTRGIQKLKLGNKIILLDSPGVIPKKEYSTHKKEKIAQFGKLGGKSYSQIKEPELVVHKIIKEHPDALEKQYKIDSKGDSEILIEKLGKRKGFMKRGGLVDEDKTARFILKDWQRGKIKI